MKSIPCKYVRFHSPVPRYVNDEPVGEMKLEDAKQAKYVVDSILLTDQGVHITLKDNQTIVPLANVVYVRPL